jgi:hypothetical protein
LAEANYSGQEKASETEDSTSSWRVGLVWLVDHSDWSDWEAQIIKLRRESGAAEEISFDALQVTDGAVDEALDSHGLSRLLLHTRALFRRSTSETEMWLSADGQVGEAFGGFSQEFYSSSARGFAQELEKLVASFTPPKRPPIKSHARRLANFEIKNFRNLDSLEIGIDSPDDSLAQAIILFGPNGTGKSSIAEAISLAAFGTSPRFEQFLVDKDVGRRPPSYYLDGYIKPFQSQNKPTFAWNKANVTPFTLNENNENQGAYDGIVLNQEDSLKFTEMTREQLATVMLKGYSSLADHLSSWLTDEERRVKEKKDVFARKHGLTTSIRLSETAYDRLAQNLFRSGLNRPTPEFLSWLDLLSRRTDQRGSRASELASAWRVYQSNVATDLAKKVSQIQARHDVVTAIADAIDHELQAFDRLAAESIQLSRDIVEDSGPLREQIDQCVTWIDVWGAWLAERDAPRTPDEESSSPDKRASSLTDKMVQLEKRGKAVRGRVELLTQMQQFLTEHWSEEHPDVCPMCDSNVADRKGIDAVVKSLRDRSNKEVETLRSQYLELQTQQKQLTTRLKRGRRTTHPLSLTEQATVMSLLAPFLPTGIGLEAWIGDNKRREQLKSDVSRMKTVPDTPQPYSDRRFVAEKLAYDFQTLSEEADKALDGPQAVAEVRKALEKRMEKILIEHLPETLGKVWTEIALALTPAKWLLPERPRLALEKNAKGLSVRLQGSELLVRYIYNAAERHVLGLAWFFTLHLARKRFEEAWMLLDDAAQEMDQTSFRELIRFVETLLRINQKNNNALTLILTLHQEDRALDAARATDARLYVLGWQDTQDDSGAQSSVKRVVLLAPGFHPLKPETMFVR